MVIRKQYLTIFFLLTGLSFTALAITRLAQKENAVVKSEKESVTAPDALEAVDEETPVDEDPWKELQQLTAAYYHHSGISYRGQMKLIDDNGEAEKVLEETPFEYTLYGDQYYYRLGEVEMVGQKDFVLLVNHAAKVMGLTPRSSGEASAQPFDLKQFRRQLEKTKATLKLSELKGSRILTVDQLEDPTIQGYRIFYDPQTYRISKIELGMQRLSPLEEGEESNESENEVTDAGREELQVYTYYVEMHFSNVQPLNLKKEEFHPEAKFITYDQHTAKLMPEYSTYTFLNADEH